MSLIKNEIYNAKIIDITNEGNGVAKVDNFTVFVPNTAVGDEISLKVIKINSCYAIGRVEEIIEKSKDRIEVDCESFNQCGGCAYRHISYNAELLLKENQVRACFERIGKIDTPVSKIIGSERETCYRNKAQYPVGRNKDGKIISGFYARRSHRIIDSDSCFLQNTEFAEIKNFVIAFCEKNKIEPYDEESAKGLLRHIYIRKAEATNEIMLCLVVTSFKLPLEKELIAEITKSFPQIKSIVLNKNPKNTNVILGSECKTIYGREYITDIICGVKINISPLSFYQVNKNQAEALYNKAIEKADLKNTDILLDLYCGTGTIGLIASNKAQQVIGVEIIREAIEDAKKNASMNQIENAEFYCSDAGELAVKLASEGRKIDVVIVDPPRKGIDENVVSAIEVFAPKKVVMVSCNPATAARDCKALEEIGYTTTSITPVDMFPRTTHVECVIAMEKKINQDV